MRIRFHFLVVFAIFTALCRAQGIITTIAGNGTTGFSGDGGAAINAALSIPSDLALDSKGNIYETAAGGVWIISPEGKHLGTILTPELAANVEFGDADRKTLYIAARTSIYKIRVNTPGIP